MTSKWYADDGTLVANSMEDTISLLDLVNQFSEWPGIHLNSNKCNINAFLYDIQPILRKQKRDDALKARHSHVILAGCQIKLPHLG